MAIPMMSMIIDSEIPRPGPHHPNFSMPYDSFLTIYVRIPRKIAPSAYQRAHDATIVDTGNIAAGTVVDAGNNAAGTTDIAGNNAAGTIVNTGAFYWRRRRRDAIRRRLGRRANFAPRFRYRSVQKTKDVAELGILIPVEIT